VFAQSVQNDNAADREGHDGGERGDEHEHSVEVKDVGE
jgi:hypothetical protein